MNGLDLDIRVRHAAFAFLENETQIRGEVLPRRMLENGFIFEGDRVPLISPQGIFTPRILRLPLTFCTVPPNLRHAPPYDDEVGEGGLMRYRYRGRDPMHRDNVGLRTAMRERVPLIYLYGTVPGFYEPVWPAYIVGDDPASLTFSVAVDEKNAVSTNLLVSRDASNEAKQRYITVEVQARLHQRSFRDRVLTVYKGQCAICCLRHSELLEAAHILPDKHPQGQPVIPNGISMCKLHHSAYDANIMGITPDYILDIREDILRERDGPMLRYGLQELNGQSLHVPKPGEFRPNRDFLDVRYHMFKKAG